MDQFLKWASAHPAGSGVLLYLAFGLLALLAGKRSQIDAWVEEHPRLAGVMKILRGVGLDPWLPIQGITLLVFGRLPKFMGVTPKLPPPLVLLAFMPALAALTGGVACAAAPPPPTHAQLIEAGKALAFNEAAVALTLLDKAEADRQDAIKSPTDAQVLQASARVALLREARDYLKLARSWILGESDADGPEVIRKALGTLVKVVDSIKAEGGQVPPAVDAALAAGRGYL